MRIRLIRTMVLEYEPEPKWYPEGATIEQMAEIDCATDDIEELFSGNLISDDIKYEILKEDE